MESSEFRYYSGLYCLTVGRNGQYNSSIMTQPETDPVASSRRSSFQRLFRTLLGSWPGRLCLLVLLASLFGWALWYNQHRSATWHDTLNPLYWVARSRGDDLYLPATAFLKHGNRHLHEIALTFDDGPHVESRAQILDTLKQYHAHATFFDVGVRMAEQPSLLRRTLDEGNEVGNHSSLHQRLDGLSAHARHREINDADITFYRITRRHLTLLRPPGERYNDAVLADTKAKGYIVVGHSSAAHDYETDISPGFIIDRTCASAENGSIVLLHDYPATAKALPEILRRLSAQGYRFVTISEMIAHLPERPRKEVERFISAQ